MEWSPTHFDSSIRYNSVARCPGYRLTIKSAEVQLGAGRWGSKLCSMELNPQIFDLAVHDARLAQALCHWADQGGTAGWGRSMAVSRGMTRVGKPWKAGVLVAGEGVLGSVPGQGTGVDAVGEHAGGLVNGRH